MLLIHLLIRSFWPVLIKMVMFLSLNFLITLGVFLCLDFYIVEPELVWLFTINAMVTL